MIDILKELLYLEQEQNHFDFDDVPGYKEARTLLNLSCEKIQRAFGAKFLEEHMNAAFALSELENLACFRHGFRLAARLVQEAFSSRL